ncbi:MAG: hypothetical protein ACRD9L_22875, partial [Bryobacteraceae bacterium]
GLQSLPEEATLLSLRESIQADHAAWKHQKSLQEIVGRAERWAQEGRLAEALQLIRQTLAHDPKESELAALQRRLELAWEEHLRREAVRQAASGAEALIRAGQFEEALHSITLAAGQYPGEAALESLRAQAQQELDSLLRRRQTATDAESLLAQGRLEESVRLLRDGLTQFAGDAALSTLLARAESELREQQRKEAIERAVLDAKTLTAERQFDRALATLRQNLDRWPGETSLLEQRRATQAAQDAWKREQAVSQAVSKAQSLLREDRVAQGLTYVETALKEFPGAEPLLAVRRQFQARKRMLEASGLIGRGQPAEALRVLLDLASSEPSSPELSALIRRAEDEVRAQEHAAEIKRLVAEAQARTEAGDFDGAVSIVDAGLKQWPDEPGLTQIRRQTVSAEQARRREQAVQSAIGACEELEKEGRLADALRAADDFLTEFEGELALLQFRDRVLANLEADRQRQIRERDIAELRRLDRAGVREDSAAQAAEMLELAQAILRHYPNDAEIHSLGSAAVDHLSAIVRAGRELAAHNFAAARALCAEFLVKYPGHPFFSALQTEAEHGEQLAYVRDLQGRTSAETNLEARIRLLEEGLRGYPGEFALQEELRFARNKLGLVNSIAEAAAAKEAAGHWDQALEQWNSLAAIYKEYPGLEANLQRARQKREEERDAAVAGWARQIEQQLETGDVPKAAALLAEAAAVFPDAAILQQLGRRVEALGKRKAEARDLLSLGHAECGKGRYREGGAALQRSFELDADPRRRTLVLGAFLKYARAALQSGWKESEALVVQAVALDPGFSAPDDLVRGIADRKRTEAVDRNLATAEHLIQNGDPWAALRELDATATAYPDERRLKQRRDTLAA